MKQFFEFLTVNADLIIVIAIALIAFIILFILVYLGSKHFMQKEKDIAYSLSTPRFFVIDFSKDSVVFFNRGDYGKRKEGGYDLLYSQFFVKDHDPLSLWLESLLDEEALVPLYYEIDVLVRSEKKSYRSLLRVFKVDYERKIIHLESSLYRYLLPERQIGRKKSEERQAKQLNTNQFGKKAFAKLHKKDLGVFAVLSLEPSQTYTQEKEEVDHHLFLKLKDIISQKLNPKRLLLSTKDYKAGIMFLGKEKENVVFDILNKIKKQLESYSEVNGYTNISIGIAISSAKHFKDHSLFLKTTYELSGYAHKRPEKIIYYEPTADLKEFDITLFRKDLEKVITERKFNTYFQPVVSSLTADVFGYITTYTPTNSLFKTYMEIKNYAQDVKLNSSLLIVLVRNAMAQFYNKRRSPKHILFLPMLMNDYKHIVEAVKKSPLYEDVPLALLINEEDINQFNDADDFNDVMTIFKTLQQEKIPLALIINDTELTLPNELYGLFNYFIVDGTIINKAIANERERLFLLASLGKLLRHKKPIIIIDLPKWTEIEYYIRAGANYVASSEICPPDPLPLPIDKKKALRIINFNKRK